MVDSRCKVVLGVIGLMVFKREMIVLNKLIKSMKKDNGFSLIEMLVALVILSTGLIAIAGLQTKMLTEGSLSKDKSVAEYYAKQKMEDLRRQGFNNLPAVSTSVSDTVNSFSANFTRTWSIANGPTSNVRLVKVLVSWLDQANLTKSVELVSYISQFDQLDFANLTYPPGSNTNPIATITDWKPNNNWGKDVIVKFKTPQGETKYYMSNSAHTDNYLLTDPGSSSDWTLVQFVEGVFTWTPNNTSTHSVCELRFGNFNSLPVKLTDEEVTAFGIKPNGSVDPTAINTNAGARRCSPNMLSGIGILTTKYACVVKAGESKKIFTQCEIEDGSGGTSTVGPLGPFTGTQTGININLCQTSGSCAIATASPTPAVTSTPTPTPVVTAEPTTTPVVTATVAPTATPVATATPVGTSPSPIPPATISVIVNMGNGNTKDGTTCQLGSVLNATCSAASSWSTGAIGSGQGIAQRSYSTTCTVNAANATVAVRCGNTSTNNWSNYVNQGISSGNTTTYTFDNM